MKLATVGVGQAGTRNLDQLLEYEATHTTDFIEHAIAVGSTKETLQALTRLPESNRLLIGRSMDTGDDADTDRQAGEASVRDRIDQIQEAIGRIETSRIDGLLVVAALGGQTGSGGGPVIAQRLQSVYSKPVYGVGILPTTDEGQTSNHNAAASLKPFVEQTDNMILFDNDVFKPSSQNLTESYTELATRVGTLFSAGAADAADETVPQLLTDQSEIERTLNKHGLASLGYAAEAIETNNEDGLLDRLLGSDEPDFVSSGDAANRITTLVRQATLRTLTLPCEVESAARALLIVTGPPEHLARDGIDNARSWLEETTGCRDVLAGGYPTPNEDRVAALVVLSGVTEVPRIKEIQALATGSE